MPLSQNARFVGELLGETGDDDPPGHSLAQLLATALPRDRVVVNSVDNWRDSGWVLECTVDGAELDLVIARGSDDWFLQVAPRDVPGLLRRVFGARLPETSHQAFLLANVAASILQDAGCEHFRWRLDGPPEDGDPPQPIPP